MTPTTTMTLTSCDRRCSHRRPRIWRESPQRVMPYIYISKVENSGNSSVGLVYSKQPSGQRTVHRIVMPVNSPVDGRRKMASQPTSHLARGYPCRGCIPSGCEVHLHKHLLSSQGHEVKIKVHPSLKMHMCNIANNNNNNNVCSICSS